MNVPILASAFADGFGYLLAVPIAIGLCGIAGIVVAGRGHWLGLLFGLATMLLGGWIGFELIDFAGMIRRKEEVYAIEFVWPGVPILVGAAAIIRFFMARRRQRSEKKPNPLPTAPSARDSA